MGSQQSTLAPAPVKGSKAQFLPAPCPPVSYGTVRAAAVEKLLEGHIDLASNKLGTSILECSDEFFAEAENLLKPEEAIYRPGEFTDHGAWMDGWETRRHNIGHDWVVIRLGYAGVIAAFDIATTHFTGNHAPFASIEGTYSTQETPNPRAQWREIMPKAPLEANSHNYFGIDPSLKDMAYTHLRLKIYPDGGVARFRAYGDVSPMFPPVDSVIDLAAVGYGGKVVATSNAHFSSGDNLILPTKGKNMGDGWETRRSREPKHNDWVVLRLGAAGHLGKVCIDTAHFKGNFPQAVELYACRSKAFDPCNSEQVKAAEGGGDGTVTWHRILDREVLSADKEHNFNLKHMAKIFTHVRMIIYPDGGISRLRIWGTRDGSSPVLQGVPGTIVDTPKKRPTPGDKASEGKGKGKRKQITPAPSTASRGKKAVKKISGGEKENGETDGKGVKPSEETGGVRGIAEDLGINQNIERTLVSSLDQESAENHFSGESEKETTVLSSSIETAKKDDKELDTASISSAELSSVDGKDKKPKRKVGSKKRDRASLELEEVTIRMGGETVGKGQRKRGKRVSVN